MRLAKEGFDETCLCDYDRGATSGHRLSEECSSLLMINSPQHATMTTTLKIPLIQSLLQLQQPTERPQDM